MKPAAFVHHEPRTLEEATSLLAEVGPDDGRVLAGGQSLVPAMALRLARPAHLVDINRIDELTRLGFSDGVLSIGACVRHAAFHKPSGPGPLERLLSAVVRHIAHYPIRTRGTFCGSLANADPASEWCLVAVTLDAALVADSRRGRRTIAAADFFQGIMTTALQADELLVETRLRLLATETRFGFYEFSRRAGDFAQAMTLAAFELAEGVIASPRVGVGAVEAAPRRLGIVEDFLAGREPSQRTFEAAAELARGDVDPTEETTDGVDYKRDLVRATTLRALEQAASGPLHAAN
ncbi:MAG TPA: FAD binding domain-containing protein [Beijerinckiaceae bacterium]|nr:FAD binding domain-containing protein [Beijerinckiaceae bacterium]